MTRARQGWLAPAALAAFLALLWLSRARMGAFADPRRGLELLDAVRGRWWAPWAFTAVYAAMCALAMPGTIPTLVGGAAWGAVWGTLYNTLGANLGASAAFWIARGLGRGRVQKLLATGRLKALEEGVEKEGFLVILTLRLVPLFPFNAINFGAGLSGVRYRDYALGSLLGMLPGTFIYTYLADSLLKGAVQGRAAFGRVALAGVLLAALSLTPRLYRRWRPATNG